MTTRTSRITKKQLEALGSAWSVTPKATLLIGTFSCPRQLDGLMLVTRFTVLSEVAGIYPTLMLTREATGTVVTVQFDLSKEIPLAPVLQFAKRLTDLSTSHSSAGR
jgi:hypothetical protein